MAIEVAKYQFQSWARRGIAAHINEQDTLGNPAALLPPNERASVPIGVSINATPQTPKDFALIGPGDIIGIQREMIVRTEPRNWITNVEPNYLAFIEFYDEDFPWRYTPARPNGERLRPWLAVLVLKEGEFDRDDRRLPLPVVSVKTQNAWPPSDESWLFAHVHTEQDIAPDQLSDLEEYLRSLRDAVTTDPDKIYSRLMSPRHLEPNKAYTAFLVPSSGEFQRVYEKGRLVPFAEYFPFAGLTLLRRQFGEVREFTPGAQQAPFPTPLGAAGMMICNEAMVGSEAVARVRQGAEWLVTLTNDSWVGRRQYAEIALAMVRLRAVEVRRWLVRASTSGPSAMIDPAGRIVDALPFDAHGTVRAAVVPRRDLTVYARLGDAFAWACVAATVLVVVFGRRV